MTAAPCKTPSARKTGRPAHILHVSTAEELEYLKDFRDLATVEVLLNHLTQTDEAYDRQLEPIYRGAPSVLVEFTCAKRLRR